MGKPTGFIEFKREVPADRSALDRIHDWNEFHLHMDESALRQQGSRCMDCGIPFCHTGLLISGMASGCPINNLIPEWNDLVYRGLWQEALNRLHKTNNFPEFTGRVCPAPCEAACTLNLNREAVGIKSIERAIVDHAWDRGYIKPQINRLKTGKKVAVVGSGPAGLAVAQQLARKGHAITVFEKNDAIGGLLRYGIPDFKLEKSVIERRVSQLREEGVTFRTGVGIGEPSNFCGLASMATEWISAEQVCQEFDAVVLAAGSEIPRDLKIPGRELKGVHFAMDFLVQQNKRVQKSETANPILATGKKVLVIGGGDTGADCVGTSNRQGAASVTQIELMPRPPEKEEKLSVWPNWPNKLRTSSSHEEGCDRDWRIETQSFNGKGKVQSVTATRIDGVGNRKPIEIEADLVLLAMGFVNPVGGLLDAFGIEKDGRGNARAEMGCFQTNEPKVFAAGDVRRGQSLVVWAIREGRDCAESVHAYLETRP